MPDKSEAKSALQKLDDGWQRLESRLCAAVLVAEIASLTLWIALKGLSSDYKPDENASGLVFRALLSAAGFGLVAHLATRKQAQRVNRAATTVAVVLGLFAGRLWVHAGVGYASNILNFLQNASVLMLIGGLRGLATRLTLWVALLGASLATSRGRHINVDVLVRYVPARLRVPAALVGQIAAMFVCFFGAVGFADYIAISVYRADATQPCPDDKNRSCDAPASAKLATVEHEMSSDFFLLGRQASLDLGSWPAVVAGKPYDKWLTAAQWNTWLDGADWKSHFSPVAVDALHMDPSAPTATRMPQVAVPGTGEQARGLLVRELDFVFPFGLLVIGLKFLLRILLILTGRVKIDLDSAHADEELANAQERDEEAATATAPKEVAS